MSIRNNRISGFTMVEMMVAIVVGLIVLGGLIQITASQKQAFRLQQSANFLQENARFAVRTLDYGLRMSDHWGGVEPEKVGGSVAIGAGIGSCTAAWVTDTDKPIEAFDGSGSVPIDCIVDDNYLADTDMIVIRYARPSYKDCSQMDGDDDGTVFLRSGVGESGQLFLGADCATAEGAIPSVDGVYNWPFALDLFYVRPCSDPGADDLCDADDDDGNPLPSLVSLRLQSDGTLDTVPLVEGVEQLQLEFGIDTDLDRDVDIFDNATNVTANNQWDRVVAIRFALLVRGDSKDVSLGSPGPFNLSQDTPSHTPAAAEWQRRVFSQVVQLRNRTRK